GSFNLGLRGQFLNFQGGGLNASWQPDQYSRVATRGGPVMIQPGSVSLGMGFDSDRRKAVVLNTGIDVRKSTRDAGGSFGMDAGVDLRPSSQLTVGLNADFSLRTDRTQYVANTSTLAYTPTFGKRYLFGDLERNEIGLEARVDYTFTPSLSLQMYAQPLLSSGDYVGYKQLAAPSTFDFNRFTEGTATTVGGAVLCAGGTICRDAAGV